MTNREKLALQEAAYPGGAGWGLFRAKTTAKLAERGYFTKEQHPHYGMQWRITAAGLAALAKEEIKA